MTEAEHPADRRIRELVAGEPPLPGDSQLIRNRIASAPFNEQIVRARRSVRGVHYSGRVVQSRDRSVFVHLVQRVVVDKQWAQGTTEDRYLRDLQLLAHVPQTRLVIYNSGRGPVAGLFGPNIVPRNRRGADWELFMYVVYAADRHSIITGYQSSSREEIAIPEDARWLP